MLRLRGGVQIVVKTLTGQTITLDVGMQPPRGASGPRATLTWYKYSLLSALIVLWGTDTSCSVPSSCSWGDDVEQCCFHLGWYRVFLGPAAQRQPQIFSCASTCPSGCCCGVQSPRSMLKSWWEAALVGSCAAACQEADATMLQVALL